MNDGARDRRQRLRALLEERARLLQPTAGFYAAIEARTSARAPHPAQASPALPARPEPPAAAPLPTATQAAAEPAPPPAAAPNLEEALAEEPASGRTEIDAGPVRDPSGVLSGGRIIAGYRIENLLGRGGMGEVYRATQLSVGRPVALKVLGKRLAGNPGFRDRFLREARAAGRLHHHHLIAVHDVGEAGGLMFFSMELIEGRTLKALRGDGPLTAEAALDIIRQVLLALEYAHARGVVHRDIKPDNIMIANGVVKVADLGLSRVDSDDEGGGHGATTAHGAVMGTPHYMAPEQGRDAHGADHRSDLWSVGATWYFLHYGRPPFTGGNAMDVLLKASTAELAFPAPAPSPAVCAAISRLMGKDPAARPATATAALGMIDAAGTGGVRRRRVARPRRPWWQYAATAAALTVAVAMVGWAAYRYRHAVWWQSEHERIEAMAADGRFGEALAALHDDQPRLDAGGEADSGAAYAQDLEARWEAYAQEQAGPLFARFDLDLREKQYKEAQATLRQVPESLLCPPVKAAADQRGEALEQALLDAADLAAQPGGSGATGAAVADPDQRYQQETEELRREAVALAAERFWRAFACAPEGTLAVDDGIAQFTTVGHGACDLRTTGPLAQMRTRAFTLRVHAIGGWNAEERWELDLGGAGLAVTSAGIELSGPGQPARVLETLSTHGDAVLHLRHVASAGGGTAWQCRVDHAGKPEDGGWLNLVGGDVLEVAWSLREGHSLAVGFTGRAR